MNQMTPGNLADFLNYQSRLKKDTIHNLLIQEVDGNSFIDFTESELRKHFPGFSESEVLEILRVGQQLRKDCENKTNPRVDHHHQNSDASPCFLTEDGVLKRVKDLSIAEQESIWDKKPCISASFFVKKTSKYNLCGSACSRTIDSDSVNSLDVVSILNKENRQDIVEFLAAHNFLSYSRQMQMLNTLCHHAASNSTIIGGIQEKSVAIAKGIVDAFPSLADKADCAWQSWYEMVLIKFGTLPRTSTCHLSSVNPPMECTPESCSME